MVSKNCARVNRSVCFISSVNNGAFCPKTWWAKIEQGWVWDLDDFLVNQIGHPYRGSN